MTEPLRETAPSLPSNPTLPPLWGRMETLWLWMAPLCALLFALCLPLSPNDLWYHVRAGEFIARGSIPTQNGMVLGTALTTPFYYQSWLAELTLFLTLKVGGLSGLAILRAFLLSGAIILVAITTFRRVLRLPNAPSRLLAARLTALSTVLGFAIASNNVDLRPQIFSTFFFGVWMYAVFEFRALTGKSRNRWGFFLVLWTGLWANTHGAFAVSILGLVMLALGDLISRHARAKTALAVAAASLVAVAINPRGPKIFIYIAQLSNNEIGQRFIQEWKSPGFNEWHSVLFWITGFGLLFWWARSQRTLKSKNENLGEQFVFALFLFMAGRDQRAMIWFALWIPPLFASLMVGQHHREVMPETAPPRVAQVMNAVILAILLLMPVALLPGVKAGLPWPTEFRARFAPTPQRVFPGDPPLLLENTTAVKGAEFLHAHPPRGKLFTDMVCGSYLTWATYPEVKAWCDPRIELFPVKFWEDYIALSAGPEDAVRQLDRQGFTDALLDGDNQPGLVRRLRLSGTWNVVAQNGSTILFRSSENKIGKIRSGNKSAT